MHLATINMINNLLDRTYKNTAKFSLNGKTLESKCVKVYDGDTITIVSYVFGDFYRFSVRMDGYDSPEMKSKEQDPIKRETEKKWAMLSRDYLSNLILNEIIFVKCKDYDKYGRILADVYYGGENINTRMLTSGYCRAYGGGHKNEWDFSKLAAMKNKNDAEKISNTLPALDG